MTSKRKAISGDEALQFFKESSPDLIPEAEETEWAEVVNQWFDYKRSEKKQSYKTELSSKIAVKKIHEYSDGNIHVARETVENAIANNWQGIHAMPDWRKKQIIEKNTTNEQREKKSREDDPRKQYF